MTKKNRMAHIAVVDVKVKENQEDAFLESSIKNARLSKREAMNQRFDVLQARDDPSQFALVEIYRNANGPLDHKETVHYAEWRDTVADMMASPRSATQWDTIFPSKASDFQPSTIMLERPGGVVDVTHVYLTAKLGKVERFIEATRKNAKQSVMEANNLRFDILQNIDDPSQFLMVQVYRTVAGAAQHKETQHHLEWEQVVESLMAQPRKVREYINHFPTVPLAWQVADGVL